MAARSEYPLGTFCWVDLATTDQQGAKSFYADVLGWNYQDVPTEMGTTYSLATLDSSQVTAIYPMPPSQEGAPPIGSVTSVSTTPMMLPNVPLILAESC